MVKAIFFDLDGTLISFDTHKIPQSAKTVLAELRQQGIKIFTATGRHKSTMQDLKGLVFDGYVTLNGSMCLVGDEVVYKESIPQADIHTLIDYLTNVESFPCVFVEEDFNSMNYRNKDTDDIFKLLNFSEIPICNLEEIRDRTIYQVLAFFDKEQEEQIMKILPGCKTTRWNPIFTDVVSVHSDKWVGITKMLEYFDLSPEETMAFGDGGNDISMLENAHIGVAMGNAAEQVKLIADYVTDSVDNDGILKAVRHFNLPG